MRRRTSLAVRGRARRRCRRSRRALRRRGGGRRGLPPSTGRPGPARAGEREGLRAPGRIERRAGASTGGSARRPSHARAGPGWRFSRRTRAGRRWRRPAAGLAQERGDAAGSRAEPEMVVPAGWRDREGGRGRQYRDDDDEPRKITRALTLGTGGSPCLALGALGTSRRRPPLAARGAVGAERGDVVLAVLAGAPVPIRRAPRLAGHLLLR